jgi:hypothetical protein
VLALSFSPDEKQALSNADASRSAVAALTWVGFMVCLQKVFMCLQGLGPADTFFYFSEVFLDSNQNMQSH